MKKQQLLLYCIAFIVVIIILSLVKSISHWRWDNSDIPLGYDKNFRYASLEKFEDSKFENQNPYVDAGAFITLSTLDGGLGVSVTYRGPVSASVPSLMYKASSFSMGPFTRATFYEKPNFKGKHALYENKQDLILQVDTFKETYLQGKVSSVKIELIEPFAIMYNQENLGGYSKIFTGSLPVLNNNWKNSIVSFMMSPYSKVTLYKSVGYKGVYKEFNNPSGQMYPIKFLGNSWVNTVQSLKVEQLYKVG